MDDRESSERREVTKEISDKMLTTYNTRKYKDEKESKLIDKETYSEVFSFILEYQ